MKWVERHGIEAYEHFPATKKCGKLRKMQVIKSILAKYREEGMIDN